MKIHRVVIGIVLTGLLLLGLRNVWRSQAGRSHQPLVPGELLIGVVEEHEEPRVRLAFRHGPNGWESFQTLLGMTSDTNMVARVEGIEWQVWSQPPRKVRTVAFLESEFYADRGLAVVADPQSFAWTGEPEPAFSGGRYVPVHRPVPVLAGRRTQPTSAIVERRASVSLVELFPHFRQRTGVVTNCEPGDELNPVEWEYGPEAVRIEDAARLADGRELVGLRLDFEQSSCDGIPERGWSTFWFVVDRTGQITAVEPVLKTYQGPYSMHLLDVVDFNGDGGVDPEAIFFWSGYNEDGYVLLHDRFRKQLAFSWQYH